MNMKEKALILTTAEPINDGGRRWNFIYYICTIIMVILAIGLKADFTACVLFGGFGCVLGWLVKNSVAETNTKLLRKTKFAVENKISYSQLIHELIPRLTPMGALVEKSSNEIGYPIIEFQGSIYDVTYNEDDTFCIWWRQNLAKAFLGFNHIKVYKREVAAMGIIGYHVQQICTANCKDIDQDKETAICKECNEEIKKENKFCVNCGAALKEGAVFCVECGEKIQ